MARRRLLTRAVAQLADLGQSSCAGERQHGSGEEGVGNHVDVGKV
jgi:hypothetical protein